MKIDHTKAGIRIRWGTKRVPDLTTEGTNSTAIKTYHRHYVCETDPCNACAECDQRLGEGRPT